MRLRRTKSSDPEGQEKPKEKEQMGTEVAKVEVSDGAVKFFVAKGLGKKQWIVVREIPFLDIEHVEAFGGELSVTWKGTTEAFFTKEKADVFGKLVDQVNAALDDQRKTKLTREKAAFRKSELLEIINSSIPLIDQSFDVLIGLGEKRINWENLEGCDNGFRVNLSFTGQTMPPLNLDFSKIQAAKKNQIPKEASSEAFNILKAIYGYFSGLNPEDDLKESHPNFRDAKAAISAYFMLNDLFLGQVVGDKKSAEEISELENVLLNLAVDTNFIVDIDELKNTVDELTFDSSREGIIESARGIFKKQLRHQLKPNAPLTTTQPIPKDESAFEIIPEGKATVESAEPVSKEEVVAETVVKEEIIPEPVSKVDVVSESAPKIEVVAEPIAKEETTIQPDSKEIVTESVSTEEAIIEPVANTEVKVEPVAKSGKKEKRIAVAKVEVSDSIAKFFASKGLFGKQSVVVKEIPILEIEHIEKFGNEITVSWKGVVYTFFSKEKTDVFRPLVDQVNRILEVDSVAPVAPSTDATKPAPDEAAEEPQTDTKEDTQAPASESETTTSQDKGPEVQS